MSPLSFTDEEMNSITALASALPPLATLPVTIPTV